MGVAEVESAVGGGDVAVAGAELEPTEDGPRDLNRTRTRFSRVDKSTPEGRAELERRNADHAAELEKVRDISPDDRDAFLAYVREHPDCVLKAACGQVGIRRRDVKALRETDSQFDEDYRTARGWGAEQILGGMRKLALDGVEKPLVSAGKLVTYPDGHEKAGEIVMVREYSDRALIALFNGMTPEGKAAAAGRFGLEIGAAAGRVTIQAGVPLADVFEFMRQHVGAAAMVPPGGDEIVGELVAETDEPA